MKNGDIINVFGYDWEVLDMEYKKDGILCLMKEPLTQMTFSDENKNNPLNYYPTSNIVAYLKELSKELKKKGAKFKKIKLNLTAEDGSGWEKDKFKVKGLFLLTTNMYRKYRKYIRKKNNWWWTSTAYSFIASNSNNVRIVSTDGSLGDYNADYGYYGVAPAAVFKIEDINNIIEFSKNL